MLPFNKQIIFATRPLRYALDTLTYRLFADAEPVRSLKDRHRGKPMLIVGNGPSLNNTPLDEFAHIPSIGMNKIDLIYKRTLWRPELVVCINNLVARQNQAAFLENSIPVYLAWKSRWFIESGNRKRFNFYDTNLSNAFSTNPERGLGSSATVTYIALQIAYWMGANPAILFGVDHSFNFTGPESTYQKREGPDTNHFDPNYFQAGSYWGTPDLTQSEIDYTLARKAFEADGRKVYDATVGGKLNVFEIISIERALSIIAKENNI